jgi:hypothetical protein
MVSSGARPWCIIGLPVQKISVHHVLWALLLVVTILSLGGTALWLLGEGEWGLGESLYFALVTVATVGYGELPNLANMAVPASRHQS